MNWILLIMAGLFEVGFTFCLGKAKESAGNETYAWYAGFFVSLLVSMTLLMKATQTLPLGTCLRHKDIFHPHAHQLYCRTEICLIALTM